jgi:hypothetical protein
MRRVIEELIEQRKNRQDELKTSLDELAGAIEILGLVKRKRPEIRAKLEQLHASLAAYITAQDKEWDAYANNHSTTVFKSLQWKIEKLEAEYSNLKTLISHFVGLENRLDRLLDSLDEKTATQTSGQLRAVKEQLSPVQYADFEQRFRGSREQIEKRLQKYLPLFSGRKDILDIGCGRGEFLELLAARGFPEKPPRRVAGRNFFLPGHRAFRARIPASGHQRIIPDLAPGFAFAAGDHQPAFAFRFEPDLFP